MDWHWYNFEMIVLPLNIMDLGRKAKILALGSLVEVYKPNVVLLQETMKEGSMIVSPLKKFMKD
jgi:hypothetical protein